MQITLLAWKLLWDVLFLQSVIFAGTLAAEGLYAGFVSSHLSFTKQLIALWITLTLITLIGKHVPQTVPASTPASTQKQKTAVGLAVLVIVLIPIALFKFTWWENAIISTVTLGMAWALLQMVMRDKE